MKAALEIAGGVHWVGVKDWDRRMFDGLIPLPQGTSYNAYLVRGREGTALIDTVNPGFEGQLLDKVVTVVEPHQLDYVVMNHAEPDHAGAIPAVLAASPHARLLVSKPGVDMAAHYYRIAGKRVQAVGEGEELDLGGKTLRFIQAPFLHWPETMFTYLVEDEILFPCDFLGAHTAAGMYDDQVPELTVRAQSYFGEIMMPFRKAGRRAMGKLADLPIALIAPSHGPMWRHPERILELYGKWTAGETLAKVVVAYVSMWGATERLVRLAVETLLARGIHVVVHDLPHVDLGELAKDLVDARAVVLGAPTVLGGLHPAALYAAHLLRALKPPVKYGAVLSSYGWGGGALRQAEEVLGPSGIELVGALEVKARPTEEDEAAVQTLAERLADRVGRADDGEGPGRG